MSAPIKIKTGPLAGRTLEPIDTGRLVQLLLWFPVCVQREIVPYLEASGFTWSKHDDGLGLRLVLPDTHVSRAVNGLCERVTVEEAHATKALRLGMDEAPRLEDLARVTTLRRLQLLCHSRWLTEIMRGERLSSHFQPIVHAADTSRIFAYEALMRGRDEHDNVIPPLRMIHAARESGLTGDLELEAQRAALRGALVHQLPTTIFVNINPTSVGEAGSALADTRAMIDRLGIPHRQVVFEIVEMDTIDDVEAFGATMRALQADGFRFALDDLGSGYSGLNLVHQLRPDFIKLDMALVRGVHQDAYKAMITEMVIELSKRLNIKTIAEGVETLGELDWLREQGVDFVQGYLIAKPSSPPPMKTPAIGSDSDGLAARISRAG